MSRLFPYVNSASGAVLYAYDLFSFIPIKFKSVKDFFVPSVEGREGKMAPWLFDFDFGCALTD